MSTTIRLGGVPEHFNLPIHLAIENGRFAEQGIDLQWTEFRGGTGQMTAALADDTADACILLTEGIVNAIYRGNPSKIISGYVNTPLTWGIHTAADNDLKNHNDIYSKQYAISRLGSGSHLMAMVDAHIQGQYIDPNQWVIIKNLDGALQSLESQESDVFYWEKFTTKPYVDAGRLRRVGEFMAPWPSFVIAATQKVIDKHPEVLANMLKVIQLSCNAFMQADTSSIALVAKRYAQKEADVADWFHATEWATHGWVSDKMLKGVIHNLQTAEIIEKTAPMPELVWKRNKKQ